MRIIFCLQVRVNEYLLRFDRIKEDRLKYVNFSFIPKIVWVLGKVLNQNQNVIWKIYKFKLNFKEI